MLMAWELLIFFLSLGWFREKKLKLCFKTNLLQTILIFTLYISRNVRRSFSWKTLVSQSHISSGRKQICEFFSEIHFFQNWLYCFTAVQFFGRRYDIHDLAEEIKDINRNFWGTDVLLLIINQKTFSVSGKHNRCVSHLTRQSKCTPKNVHD